MFEDFLVLLMPVFLLSNRPICLNLCYIRKQIKHSIENTCTLKSFSKSHAFLQHIQKKANDWGVTMEVIAGKYTVQDICI